MRYRLCVFCVLLGLVRVKGLKIFERFQKQEVEEDKAVVLVHESRSLTRWLGYRVYRYLDRPKYRFYLHFFLGAKLDEESTILTVMIICNLLYCGFVFGGFVVLPRGAMLLITAITFPIGPALVFFVLGSLVLACAAAATFPRCSVFCVWLFFFLKTSLFQALALRLQLDIDHDGDVDALDILHGIAATRIGTTLRLNQLHAVLNDLRTDDSELILSKVNEIQTKLDDLLLRERQRQSSQKSPQQKKETIFHGGTHSSWGEELDDRSSTDN